MKEMRIEYNVSTGEVYCVRTFDTHHIPAQPLSPGRWLVYSDVIYHGVRAFFQQNHDMTGAPKGRKAPAAQTGLWLYDARLVKWVSHTERDGRCRLPNARDLDDFAKRCEATFPRCDAAPSCSASMGTRVQEDPVGRAGIAEAWAR